MGEDSSTAADSFDSIGCPMNVAIWSNIASTRSLRATEWEESAAERVRQRRLPRVRERREQSGHGTHRCRTGGKPTAGCRGSGYRRPHSPPEVQIGSSPCSERARPSACPRQGRLATEGQQAGRQAGRQPPRSSRTQVLAAARRKSRAARSRPGEGSFSARWIAVWSATGRFTCTLETASRQRRTAPRTVHFWYC